VRSSTAKKQETSEVRLPYVPRQHQEVAHRARLLKRWSVLVWHRRAGKTVFAVMELVLSALVARQSDSRFAYLCPFLKQAKDVAWEYMKRFTRPIDGLKVNESDLSITFPNGSVIRLYGADHPDSLRGIYLDGVVLDEVGQMKRVIWGEIIRPLLADRKGWALFIGTPKGINLFSEIFWAAQKDSDWYADLRTWRETQALDPAEVEAARKTMSPQAFAQEFDCDFHAAVENVLIPLEAVQGAQERDFKPMAFDWAPIILGVDVARFGDDTTDVAPRQGSVGFRIRQFRNLNTMEVASHVMKIADEFDADAIFIDVTGGLGAGPADRLRQLGYHAIDVDFGSKADSPRYRNKRTEMWVEMGEWMKTGAIYPEDQELAQDLVAPIYFFDSSGRMCLEPKDDIKERIGRSPNRGDALACTFAAPVAPRDAMLTGKRGRAGASSRRAITEYDPYADGNQESETIHAETNCDPHRS